jgi:hypothetical protein
MRGEFTTTTLENAMAGHIPEVPGGWSVLSLAYEASNRLLQRERKAGRIKYDRGACTWTRVEGADQ